MLRTIGKYVNPVFKGLASSVPINTDVHNLHTQQANYFHNLVLFIPLLPLSLSIRIC